MWSFWLPKGKLYLGIDCELGYPPIRGFNLRCLVQDFSHEHLNVGAFAIDEDVGNLMANELDRQLGIS